MLTQIIFLIVALAAPLAHAEICERNLGGDHFQVERFLDVLLRSTGDGSPFRNGRLTPKARTMFRLPDPAHELENDVVRLVAEATERGLGLELKQVGHSTIVARELELKTVHEWVMPNGETSIGVILDNFMLGRKFLALEDHHRNDRIWLVVGLDILCEQVHDFVNEPAEADVTPITSDDGKKLCRVPVLKVSLPAR